MAAAAALPFAKGRAGEKAFQYDTLRWVSETEDPSVTLETKEIVAKIIDNTGLHVADRPGNPKFGEPEPGFSHYLGYHAIRALWRKDERRNIVAPFASWLNLQSLQVEGLELDPVDSRSRYGVGRGWPMHMEREGQGVSLKTPIMPVSGVAYTFKVKPAGADGLDFEMSFTLHKKNKKKAAFYAEWACYMSTYDEVQLYSPSGNAASPAWEGFGEKEPFIVGEAVNYVHSQRQFRPAKPPAFPAVYGRIGPRVLALMASRPEVNFFVMSAGGHRAYYPVQNPAWDLEFKLPDYEPDKPFGFRGRLIYKNSASAEEILARYKKWAAAK
jgi:hypothetical protein